MSEKKKGLFAKAIEFLTDREEKEELNQAEKKFKEYKDLLVKTKDERAIADTKQKRDALLKRKEDILHRQEARKIPTTKKHVVVAGDTLTGLAKKYYGDAKMYMVLYEANKGIIGDDPNMIKVGMELVVPEEK